MTEFTEREYPKLCAGHFLFAVVLASAFVCGFHFSGDERGEQKTAYYFSAMVLVGLHFAGLLVSLYVIISTRNQTVFLKKKTTINKIIVWYNILILNFGLAYLIVGFILTCSLGFCKGDTCYAQTKQGLNIGIAAIIAVLHLLTAVFFVYLSSRVRVLHNLAQAISRPKPKPKPQLRLRVESSDSDSSYSDDHRKTKKKKETKIEVNAAEIDNAKTDDKVGSFPFAVLARTVVTFIQARKRAKAVNPQDSNKQPSNLGSSDNFKRHGFVNKNQRLKRLEKDLDLDMTAQRQKLRPPGKNVIRKSKSSLCLPPPPPYESVIAQDNQRKRVPDQDMPSPNPYHLPPMPRASGLNNIPDNLYTGSAYPDTEIVVVHPGQNNTTK